MYSTLKSLTTIHLVTFYQRQEFDVWRRCLTTGVLMYLTVTWVPSWGLGEFSEDCGQGYRYSTLDGYLPFNIPPWCSFAWIQISSGLFQSVNYCVCVGALLPSQVVTSSLNVIACEGLLLYANWVMVHYYTVFHHNTARASLPSYCSLPHSCTEPVKIIH